MIRRQGILLIVTLLAGCSAGERVEVSGSVTLDGKPLTRGTVTLHPTSQGTAAYGQIDTHGDFRAVSRDGEHLMPGTYAATVVALEPSLPPVNGDMPQPGKNIAPIRYSDAKTSGLTFVLFSGTNRVPIELTSDVKLKARQKSRP